jgi:hypothetical protein
MRKETPLTKAALELVNQVYDAYIKAGCDPKWCGPLDDLPLGILKDEGACPIARALPFDEAIEVRPCERGGVVVTADEDLAHKMAHAWSRAFVTEDDEGGYQVCLPDALNEFALEFDAGNLPEYEEKE